MHMARLTLTGITKSYGPVQVLHGVDLTVAKGEVHGLLGENGAGKSTMLNILSGVIRADGGSIAVDGAPVTIASPQGARAAGIAMIHQELQQVPELTVAQNMYLGRPLRRLGGLIVDRGTQEARARAVLAQLDPGIDPAAPVGRLRVAQRQIVEIGKALLGNARIIAMDEPTSSLTPTEFERLVQVIAALTAQGVSVIYVSHKMDEVFRLCQRATVLRDGRRVGQVDIADVSPPQVIEMMVGRELAQASHRSFATGQVMMRVQGLTRGRHVQDAGFTLHRGEVLGVAGLVGSGRTELMRLIAGVDRAEAGTVEIAGRVVPQGVRARISAGLGLVPEERKREGIIRHRPVAVNMALPSMRLFSRLGITRAAHLNRTAETVMGDMQLRPLAVRRAIGTFSGGNQQKAIIGRWIAARAQILLFDEPTRGIDVGAKAEIYALIERLASEGHGIIVVSSELPEVIRLSDRVLVMREGRIAATLPGPEITEANIARHAIPATRP
ncbi:sugar ABC transporter ATP-binding protein [Fertoebacter nigrum]|uniref:Sugar ABC transporter ATP-binding protein n=2 Tax=Fertoeibacter niger TaxID=2656921 RepID=A0A8X8KRI4_9RHOB|nr:sugar ABC transporter ATP-binding protein [Fertoeibacter niger]